MTQASREELHLQPVHPRTSVVIACLAICLATLEIWVWRTVQSPLTAPVAGSVAATTVTGFLVGNAFRLREWRTRIGNQVRAGRRDKVHEFGRLPPLESIHKRFRHALIAAVGAWSAVGAVTLWAASAAVAHIEVVVLFAVVLSAVAYWGGTVSRPID